MVQKISGVDFLERQKTRVENVTAEEVAGDNICSATIYATTYIMSTFTHILSPDGIYCPQRQYVPSFTAHNYCRALTHIVTLLCHWSFTLDNILLHHTYYTSLSCQHSSKHWTRQKQISGVALHLIFFIIFHHLTVVWVSFCSLIKGITPKFACCVLS